MTRRCSVMRMPVAAQRASMPEALSPDDGFSAVMIWALKERSCCATGRILRQVAAHQKRVQPLPAGLLVIAFAASGHAESGPFVQPSRRLIVFLDFEENPAHAAAGEMTHMRQQQIARQ